MTTGGLRFTTLSSNRKAEGTPWASLGSFPDGITKNNHRGSVPQHPGTAIVPALGGYFRKEIVTGKEEAFSRRNMTASVMPPPAHKAVIHHSFMILGHANKRTCLYRVHGQGPGDRPSSGAF